MEYTDTTPQMDAMMVKLLQETPVWRKLELMEQLNQMTRNLALSGLRQQHPDASPTELRRLLAERILGAELAAKCPTEQVKIDAV